MRRASFSTASLLSRLNHSIVQFSATSKILIIGQAPGSKVHASGIPWNDPSGDRLRDWTGLSKDEFYDPSRVALVPMGFCYPGRLPNGGDAPPRRECAPLWHARLLAQMPDIRLTLLVGSYALTPLYPVYQGRWHFSDLMLSFPQQRVCQACTL